MKSAFITGLLFLFIVLFFTSAAAMSLVDIPAPDDRTMRYYYSGIGLWLASIAIGILVPGVVLFSGISASIRDWAGKRSERPALQIFWFFLVFTLISLAVELPFSFYAEYVRQHEYGLSSQSLEKWFQDTAIANAISFIVSFGLICILYALLRKFRERWWLYFGLGSLPFIVLVMLVKPVLIDPLFNDFHPMTDKVLESRIRTLADRAGIAGTRILQVDKSEETNRINAYVTGFLGSKRIVLWDTLIDRLEEDELEFVLGHEIGHYVLNHVIYTTILSGMMILAALFLVHLTIDRVIRRYRHVIGFDRLSDIASLPLIILMASVYSFVVSPFFLGWSRYLESEADRFSLELTRDNDAGARAFVKLQSSNLTNPRPHALYTMFRMSHPPLGERIDFLNHYRPWEQDRKMKYEKLFQSGSN